jgi:hypothetical protein
MDIPGVLDAISGSKPNVCISESGIEDLQRIMDSGCRLRLWPFALGNRTARVENGALHGISGNLESVANKRFLILPIHLIQRSIAVELSQDVVLSFAPSRELPEH